MPLTAHGYRGRYGEYFSRASREVARQLMTRSGRAARIRPNHARRL